MAATLSEKRAAEQRVAAVHVDRAEHAQREGGGQLVLEAVAGQRGVVVLDVDLDLLLQAVLAEEAVHGGGVEVVLVLGRLGRLGLDEDRALEADLVLVLDHHAEEPAGLVELLLDVGVEPEDHVDFRPVCGVFRNCNIKRVLKGAVGLTLPPAKN